MALLKEIEDTNKWKDTQSLWIVRVNIIKISRVPKEIYRIHVILIKMPKAFFTEIEKTILIFIRKHRLHKVKVILRKNEAKAPHCLI